MTLEHSAVNPTKIKSLTTNEPHEDIDLKDEEEQVNSSNIGIINVYTSIK